MRSFICNCVWINSISRLRSAHRHVTAWMLDAARVISADEHVTWLDWSFKATNRIRSCMHIILCDFLMCTRWFHVREELLLWEQLPTFGRMMRVTSYRVCILWPMNLADGEIQGVHVASVSSMMNRQINLPTKGMRMRREDAFKNSVSSLSLRSKQKAK